jgi:hypothetical protein
MLVATWLNGIGLEYAVATFEAAGIVTPNALAELNVAHFEALGIKEAEDRRKLFYLTQRIKLAVRQQETADDELLVDEVALDQKVEENLNQPLTIKNNDDDDDLDDILATDDETDTVIQQIAAPIVRHGTTKSAAAMIRTKGLAKPKPARQSTGSVATKNNNNQLYIPSGIPPRKSLDRHDSSSSDGSRKFQRRNDSKLQPKSMRTGKPLSSIPDSTVAAMSPLISLKRESKLTTTASTANVSAMDRNNSDSSHSAKSNGSHQRRRSHSGTTLSSHFSKAVATKKPTGPASVTSRKSLGARVHGGTDNTASRTLLPKSQSSDIGSVIIQGRSEDTSFATQIAHWRDDTNAGYELIAGTATTQQQQHQQSDTDEDMRIRVVIRKRPRRPNELGDVDIIHPLTYSAYGRILVNQPRTRVDLTKEIETVSFAFDNVLDEAATNRDVYEQSVRHLIPSLFDDGRWVSIFAYGQTGSGKKTLVFRRWCANVVKGL